MRLGFIGHRGMVGSVLLQRMIEEEDFKEGGLVPVFFSTSQKGSPAPSLGPDEGLPLQDAFDIKALSTLDAIVSCQGGEYTKRIFPLLRGQGWKGYWIDSSSALREQEQTILPLDPINGDFIRERLHQGARTFAGANCTVSLSLMALHGTLSRGGLVEWVNSMTYQAISGAGAGAMGELIDQVVVAAGLREGREEGRGEGKGEEITPLERERQLSETLNTAVGHTLWPLTCSPGSTPQWTTANLGRSGRGRSRPIKSSGVNLRFPSTELV